MAKNIRIHTTEAEAGRGDHWTVGTFHRYPTRTSPGTGMFAHMGPLEDYPIPDPIRIDDRFEVFRPSVLTPAPVLVHVPHAGLRIPDDVRETFVAPPEVVARDLQRSTDQETDRLWRGAVSQGATMVVNRISRLVCDVERFADDAREPAMAAAGRGAVYLATEDEQPLRRPGFTAGERQAVIDRFYTPWQELVADECERLLERFGKCRIIDAHTFPARPLGCETDQGPRPDICLGWGRYHSPQWWREKLVDVFERAGFSVEVNRPFAGSFVPGRYFERERRVRSVMVEVNRALYLGEDGVTYDVAKAERVKACLREVVKVLGARF